jgi:hypothetical protein
MEALLENIAPLPAHRRDRLVQIQYRCGRLHDPELELRLELELELYCSANLNGAYTSQSSSSLFAPRQKVA